MRSLTLYAEKIKKYIPKTLYKAGAQAYIDKTYPRHIFIETTAECNLTCSYCPREERPDEMDFGLFRSIVREASRFGPRSFSLHLFGEPLLYSNILGAIECIKGFHKDNVVIITTNGTRLNHYCRDLIRLGVDEIVWSWRTEAKFKESTIADLERSTKRGRTIFRVRILKEETPEEEIERWSKWPVVEVRSLHNYGGNIDLSQKGVPPVGTRWACYHLWLSPAVAWNGNILLCCADPHQKEVLGTYPKDTLTSVWQGRKLSQVRKAHLAREYSGICERCDVWKNYPDLFYSWQYTTPSSSVSST